MEKKKILIIQLLIILFLPISCLDASKTKASPPSITVEVFTDKFIFFTDETITIHIKVTNPTNSSVELDFPTSFQFDYIICDIFGREIYRWSADKAFLQVRTQIRIPPQSYYLKNFTHKLSEFSLFPGVYSIEGRVRAYGSDITWIVVVPTFLVILITLIAVTVVIISIVLIWRRKNKKSKRLGSINQGFYFKTPFSPQGKASMILTLTKFPIK